MALANIAELFYRSGKNVLMIDWDLEAPGLERFFFKGEELDEIRAHEGIMDILLDYKQQMREKIEFPENGELPFKKPEEFFIDVYPESDQKNHLWLITPGKRTNEDFSNYANTVLSFDWGDFYENWQGESYLEWFRQECIEKAEVVLIDSRTGITEIGGICTYHLADVVILLCAANDQNINGTLRMVRNFSNPDLTELRRGRKLATLIIPARIEKFSQVDALNRFRRKFAQEFIEYIPLYNEELEIPYVPIYAFEEIIASNESKQSDYYVPELVEAYSKIFYQLTPKKGSLPSLATSVLYALGAENLTDRIKQLYRLVKETRPGSPEEQELRRQIQALNRTIEKNASLSAKPPYSKEEELRQLKYMIRETMPGSQKERELRRQIQALEREVEGNASFSAENPWQLPSRARYFTGREAELATLLEDLQPGRVVTLCGPGGIGKTALAAEAVWALKERNELQQRFPDGVIFYSFYGRPDHALAFEHIIRSFDPEAQQFSAQNAEQLLINKCALLLLDGTEEVDDFQSILKIRGMCGVLVTSRRKADAVAERQDMPSLPIEETVNLLRAWGGDRVKEDEATQKLCKKLGGLPLAVRLAGRYLSQTGETAAEYLEWLETQPFEALRLGEYREENVKMLLERSVQQISEDAQRVLAVVGVLNLSPFAVEPLVAALELSVRQMRAVLGELMNYGLLVRPVTYYTVSHALIHTYASRCLSVEPDTLRRLAGYYTNFAKKQSEQGLAGYARLDTERVHLMRVIDRCQAQEEWQSVNALVWAVNEYLDIRGYWTEWVTALKAGIHAARQQNERHDESVHLSSLGLAYTNLGQVDKAIEYYEQALTIAHEIGDRFSEGSQLGNLGLAYADLGQVAQAIEYYEQALAIDREIGDRRGEGSQLGNLGLAYADLGQVDKAIEYHQQALIIARVIGDRRGEGSQLGNLGLAYADLGQVDKAIEYHQQALIIARVIGDRRGEGSQLGNLGLAYADLGQVDKAIEYHQQALIIARVIGDRRGEGSQLGNLGLAYADLGQVDKAIEYHQQALTIAREIGDRFSEGNILGNLGNVYLTLGQLEHAINYCEQSLAIAREISNRRIEGEQLKNLGKIYGTLEKKQQAMEHYQQALAIFEEMGLPEANEVRQKFAELDNSSGT